MIEKHKSRSANFRCFQNATPNFSNFNLNAGELVFILKLFGAETRFESFIIFDGNLIQLGSDFWLVNFASAF